MTSIVVAAGGTGGHIYPGLATADAIRALDPEAHVTFIGTPRGLEQQLIPAAGYDLELTAMVPWRGARRSGGFALATMRASRQAAAVLRRVKAQAVVAMGGYPSLPTVLAARRARIPVVIHESGATGGRANRLNARFTQHVALSFASAAPSFPGRQVRVVGMPLSKEFSAFDRAKLRDAARQDYGVTDEHLILVNGGSQGSVTLNELAVGLAGRWEGRDDVRIVLKTGPHEVPASAVLRPVRYLPDPMTLAYAAADVAITRAGAGTVAELATCGLPSILVPYPFSLDDDQGHNAKVLVEVGAAVLVRDPEATPEVVGPKIEQWMAEPATLAAMATAADGASHAHAATTLAEWVLELAATA